MKSPTLALLLESGEEPTRENFLNLALLGEDRPLSAEEEFELPEEFQTHELDAKLRERSRKKIEAESEPTGTN